MGKRKPITFVSRSPSFLVNGCSTDLKWICPRCHTIHTVSNHQEVSVTTGHTHKKGFFFKPLEGAPFGCFNCNSSFRYEQIVIPEPIMSAVKERQLAEKRHELIEMLKGRGLEVQEEEGVPGVVVD